MLTQFEWDPEKSAGNLRKHGLSFEEALRVFADPRALEEIDDRYEEERWKTIGRIEGCLIILVAHTLKVSEEVTVIRIISARPAEKRERDKYERQL